MFLYLVIILSIVTYSISRYLFHNHRNLPPTPFPIIPVIGHLHLLKRPLHHRLIRLAAIHGPIMFLHFGSRPVLVVSSPSAAEECMTKNDVVFANRPRLLFGKYLGNDYTTLTWSPYGENWRNLRKMVSVEILSAHRLQRLMSVRAEEVKLLVRRLAMHCHAAAELLIAAGTETILYTLEWAMTLLLNHPEVLKKAQAEIDTMVGFDRLVIESDLVNLPYLHCIIAETLRMYPPGPLGIPHESSDDCVVGGYLVPKGTTLLLNLYAIHRDPSHWPDANKFKPERFEGTELGAKFNYKLMPFGAGRRICPGENLALKMVGLALGALIQCFEWDRVSHELVDMTEGMGLTMTKAKPLMAKCRLRRDIEPVLFQMEA